MAYKVLYIEDQPDAIELVRLALRRIDCDVTGVLDGLTGLEMMRRMQPDLVLLDLMLPGWDGWQVREAMQADPLLSSIPVVLVTARTASTDPASGRCLPEADAYVSKPYSLASIRNTVQCALAERYEMALVS